MWWAYVGPLVVIEETWTPEHHLMSFIREIDRAEKEQDSSQGLLGGLCFGS